MDNNYRRLKKKNPRLFLSHPFLSMEDNTLCGKRMKGLKDLDVGASATHTALMEQLSTLDAITATTKDPLLFSRASGGVNPSTGPGFGHSSSTTTTQIL